MDYQFTVTVKDTDESASSLASIIEQALKEWCEEVYAATVSDGQH